jgi:AhpD family alkylhydroperoxidase
MTRDEVYAEMKEMMGVVPTFFTHCSDNTIGLEWELFKAVQMAETPIPNKYKELIGCAVAAVTRCKYCAYFHHSMAKLFGATDAEIEDAVHYAK